MSGLSAAPRARSGTFLPSDCSCAAGQSTPPPTIVGATHKSAHVHLESALSAQTRMVFQAQRRRCAGAFTRNTEPIDDEEDKIWFDRHGMVLAQPPSLPLFLRLPSPTVGAGNGRVGRPRRARDGRHVGKAFLRLLVLHMRHISTWNHFQFRQTSTPSFLRWTHGTLAGEGVMCRLETALSVLQDAWLANPPVPSAQQDVVDGGCCHCLKI